MLLILVSSRSGVFLIPCPISPFSPPLLNSTLSYNSTLLDDHLVKRNPPLDFFSAGSHSLILSFACCCEIFFLYFPLDVSLGHLLLFAVELSSHWACFW
jgi:hypothetical protein